MCFRYFRKKQLLIPLSAVLFFAGVSAFPGQSLHAESLPTLTILVPKVEQFSFDGDKISAAVNQYAAPLIGCNVELIFTKFEQFSQTVGRYETADQLPDILFLWSNSDTVRLMNQNQLAALETLLPRYGQNLLSVVDPDALKANTYDGHLYAIPTVHDQTSGTCFEYRVEIAEKYDLPMENVHSYEDLTEIFQKLHEQAPDIIPCDMIQLEYYDPLGDSLGVLMDYKTDSTVTNLYETPEFENFVRTLHAWQEAGYLLDADLGFNSTNRYVSSPELFGKFSTQHPALIYVDSADAGEELRAVPLTETFVSTNDMWGISYSVAQSCENKELAVRFLDLLYTDPALINLLTYGIEGDNYQLLDEENGVIGFPDGVTRQTSDYYQFRGYNWGNEFLSYLWEGYPLDLWEQEKKSNKESPRSVAFGFSYSSQPVARQVASCSRIATDYLALLNSGIGDTDALLLEFQTALHMAGIDKIIAEKQRQLDLFLAEKESP